MGSNARAPTAPDSLPRDAVEMLDRMSDAELRDVIDYARARQRHLRPDTDDRIEPRPDEEVVRVEERDGYTAVVKRQPCTEGCERCPHGPFLYHVYDERRPEGGTNLHWAYIGRIGE